MLRASTNALSETLKGAYSSQHDDEAQSQTDKQVIKQRNNCETFFFFFENPRVVCCGCV